MYILFEIQTNGNVSAVLPAQTFANINDAESAAHFALASAAISSVETHAVLLVDETGNTVRLECYHHHAT